MVPRRVRGRAPAAAAAGWRGTGLTREQPGARPAAARAVGGAAVVAPPRRAGAGAGCAVGARLRPGAAGRLDAQPTWPGAPCPAPTRWPRRSACACSGSRHERSTRTWTTPPAAAGGQSRPAGGPPRSAAGPGVAHPGRRARHGRLLAVRRRRSARWRRCAGCASGRAPARIRALVGARAQQDESLADLRRARTVRRPPGRPRGRRVAGPAAARADRGRDAASPTTTRSSPTERVAPVPPVALWVRGPARLDEIVDRSVALVGSRASTAYGEHVAGGARPPAGGAGLDRGVRRCLRHRRAPRTAARWPPRRRPWRCWPAASTGPIRPRTARCSTASPRPDCWSASGPRGAHRCGTGSSSATG